MEAPVSNRKHLFSFGNSAIFIPCTNEEEESELKSFLEEEDMNEQQDNARSMEPEMIIRRLNHQVPFHGCMLLRDLMR